MTGPAPSERPFRLGILTALWRRPELAAAMLEHHRDLGANAGAAVPGVQITVFAVRSPEDPEPTPGIEGIVYTDAPNAPLSSKWATGMQMVRPFGLDAVMILGSDDFVTAGYIHEAVSAIQDGAEIASPLSIVFIDRPTMRGLRAVLPRIGAGRTLSASLLDRLGYAPWPDDRDRHLDGSMDAAIEAVTGSSGVARVGLPCGATPYGRAEVLDVKTGVNLWDYETALNWASRFAGEEVNARAYLAEHFPGVTLAAEVPS